MRILLVVFGLLSMSYSICQPLFNKTYQAPWINLSSNIEIFGNNYYVLGQRLDDINKKITLMQLDENGDTLQTSFYGEVDRAFFAQKLILRSNDILVFGGVSFDDFGLNSDLFLASFDYNFSVNWIKYYGGPNFDDGTDMIQNTDGTLMMCGSKSTSSANIEDFYLIKTDSNGNVIWEKTYGGNNVEKAFSIIYDNDDGYLLSGYSNSFSSSYDLLVYNLDVEGNIKWQKTIGGSLTDYAGVATKLKDKTFILQKNESNSTQNRLAKLTKINSIGEIIWTKSFPNSNGNSALEFTKPFELLDGSIILTGVFINSVQNPISKILKLDPLGNIIWQRDYFVRADRSQYIYDIQTTSDGGFVFCGSAFDSTNTQRNWVAKLDCFGCDGVLCDSTGVACELYDCSTKDFDADMQASALSVELYNANHTLNFSDNASQSSNREWILPDTTLYTVGSVSYTFDTPGTYPITLINYHGVCSDTSVVMVEVGYGLKVNEQKNNGFELYPNPTSDIVQVKSDDIILEIEVYDVFGRLLKTQKYLSSECELNLSELAKGEYLLKLISSENILSKRITKR
jgi:hypothetical protein